MDEYTNNTSDYFVDKSLEFMKIIRLDRIIDELDINNETMGHIADSLEALTECVGYIPPTSYQIEGIHFIRIGGSIDTM